MCLSSRHRMAAKEGKVFFSPRQSRKKRGAIWRQEMRQARTCNFSCPLSLSAREINNLKSQQPLFSLMLDGFLTVKVSEERREHK
jgi:hypothetical protein